MNKQTRYAIRLPDGRCLGRYTITGDIVMGFPDAELAPLSECLKPRSKPNP